MLNITVKKGLILKSIWKKMFKKHEKFILREIKQKKKLFPKSCILLCVS